MARRRSAKPQMRVRIPLGSLLLTLVGIHFDNSVSSVT